jgi:hypothetical protein
MEGDRRQHLVGRGNRSCEKMDRDQILGSGDRIYLCWSAFLQLTFAKENGIEVSRNPKENNRVKTIVIPESVGQVEVEDFDIAKIYSYIDNALKGKRLYPLRRRYPVFG